MPCGTVNLHLTVLLLSLCVSLVVTEEIWEMKSLVGDSVVLKCTATYRPEVQYRLVSWYKELTHPTPNSRLSGLLSADLSPDAPRPLLYSGVSREVSLFGASRLDLYLSNLTCADAGAYSCRLSAPIGEQNQEGRVLLTVTDCPTEFLHKDVSMVIIAMAVLLVALFIFGISYVSLRNLLLKERTRVLHKEPFPHSILNSTSTSILNSSPYKPLDKKDLQSIYTLGPRVSKTPLCV